MSLLAGSVSVDAAEVATGAGLAFETYGADVATFAALLPNPNAPPAGFTPALWLTTAKAIRLAALQERARQANAYAAATVAHVVANAVVNAGTMATHVVAGTSLGRTPNPNTADTALQGLTIDVEIPITHTGTVS